MHNGDPEDLARAQAKAKEAWAADTAARLERLATEDAAKVRRATEKARAGLK